MNDIRFAWVCRNQYLDFIERIELTDTMLIDRAYPSWITSDNCEVLAKIRPTGLKDKNGKEVFEGDVLKFSCTCSSLTDQGTVVWDGESAAWAVKEGEDGDLLQAFDPKGYEIIGNIWQHPELLP